jgi:large exoprotein involved in heme utilization and adhesion
MADAITLDRAADITAFTRAGAGGNVEIQAQSLVLRGNSLISATGGGLGNGGNITIASPIIVGIENSDIVANAFQGRGGNIQITTQGIFGLQNRDRLTPENDITASSEFGVNGTVAVNNIGVDPNSGSVTLPVDIIDPSQKIATGCAAKSDSSFVATGRGGMPQDPMQVLKIDRTWSDLRSISHAKPEPKIAAAAIAIEATALATNSQGQPELIAQGAIASPQIVATCSKL